MSLPVSVDSKWSFATSFDFENDAVGSICARQIHYLQQFRQGWRTLYAPRSWLDYHPTPIGDDNSWLFHGILVQSVLKLIEGDLTCVSDSDLEAQSPHSLSPNFQLSSERHPYFSSRAQEGVVSREACKFMSRCQISQILEYQGVEAFAESAIATALDGVPSAYVRRNNLSMSFGVALSGSSIHNVDCALLYTPIAPSSSFSLARFKNLPISSINPALVLCAKGPTAWTNSLTHPPDFLTTQRSLAFLASGSLASIIVACQARSVLEGGSTSLPDWAMTIGIVYDAEAIRLIAHIPYLMPNGGETRFLSVLFDTLPFPEWECGEPRSFFRDRYRVAIAMLCIQHHAFRLTSIWESPGLLPVEPSRLAGDLANFLGVEPLQSSSLGLANEMHAEPVSSHKNAYSQALQPVNPYDAPTPSPSEPQLDASDIEMFTSDSLPPSQISPIDAEAITTWKDLVRTQAM